jgi:putative chitinase
MNTDPWEGIGPLWYWAFGKPASLNITADRGDFKQNTYLVNGGYNGLDDRYRYYGRAALHLLGRNPDDVAGYQASRGLAVDGKVGPITAREMHNQLLVVSDVRFNEKEVQKEQTRSIFDIISSFFALFMGK